MHGKAEDPPRVVFAHREIPLTVSQPLEGLLEMQWFRIIDGGRNAGLFQF
jgi:hypothetical protein